MFETKLLNEILKVVEETASGVTISFVARRAKVSWPTARFCLMKLVAEDKLGVEELSPRGLIFRRKDAT